MRIRWLLPLCLAIFCFSAKGQATYNDLAQDTIITKKGFLNTVYLLDGKRLSLEVMQFFMADHPTAYKQVQVANVTDQLSIAGYSLGGILMLGGILINEDNANLSRELFFYGGVGLGSGLIFQIISNNYQKNAVYLYNEGIKAQAGTRSSLDLYLGMRGGEALVLFRF